MPALKPKNVRNKPTFKQRIANGVATGLLASTISIGLGTQINNPMRSANQRVVTESAITKIDKKLIEVPKINSRNPNLIRETVNSYNKKAKTGQIFFYDGKKIKSVYFDQTRLSQINSILPKNEKAKIDSLISRKLEQVEATAKQNVVLSKKIIDRVGELNYKKYLLSLTPKELNNAFPEAEKAVRKALENSNPEILKRIKAEHRSGSITGVVTAFISGLLIGAMPVRRKK